MSARGGGRLAAMLSLLALASAGEAQTKSTGAPIRMDSHTISGLGARNIGSAAMSGRIAAVAAVHEGGRLTIYAGAASGGVWKSVNGGTTFKPIFDNEPVQSIGAITIDPHDSKVVWVGTGETWTRNSVSIGDGIYKSVDAGETWTNDIVTLVQPPVMAAKSQDACCAIGVVATVTPSVPSSVYQ